MNGNVGFIYQIVPSVPPSLELDWIFFKNHLLLNLISQMRLNLIFIHLNH